ncbi:MAG: metallophosphoesterase family protein [Verrucomicrobia bacterium]|nr:metallophosphoesterase family protein [Verrucomicrobiota bacterium]
MRIAVVSDTHDRYPEDLPGRLRGADEIWHLGDVCEPEVLAEFESLGAPLIVVRGNNDSNPQWPVELTLTREGLTFHLVHIPPRHAPADARVLLHGHTHVPRDDLDVRGVRWLNPGCISFPRAGIRSFAWLTLAPGRLQRWETVAL